MGNFVLSGAAVGCVTWGVLNVPQGWCTSRACFMVWFQHLPIQNSVRGSWAINDGGQLYGEC